MNIFDRYRIINFHKKRLSGDRLHSLGWRSEKSQTERYRILASITDFSNKSVLEPGCGYCDFLNYIEPLYEDFKYTGIELFAEFLDDVSIERYNNPYYKFIRGDFSNLNLNYYDIIVASGFLSYQVLDKKYHYKMIKKMFSLCNEVLAFNFLDKNKFGQHPIILPHDKDKMIKFCKELSSKVVIYDEYLEDDVTIALYK